MHKHARIDYKSIRSVFFFLSKKKKEKHCVYYYFPEIFGNLLLYKSCVFVVSP